MIRHNKQEEKKNMGSLLSCKIKCIVIDYYLIHLVVACAPRDCFTN